MKSLYVKVPITKGESTRKKLAELGILNKSFKIRSDNQFLYVPISTRKNIPPDMEIATGEFEEAKKHETIEDLLDFTPSYEIIGDIAILSEEDVNVARAILKIHKNVRTVLYPISSTTGEFRVRDFKVVAGEPRTETTHKEHGCRYIVDIQRAYFNPHLSTERARVSAQVKPGETVIDMFAGVGPFSILIAKRAKHVIAIDKNSDAILFLRKNAELNSITNIEIIQGDVREVAARFKGRADRIIMNLPHKASEFLDEAIEMLRSDGIMHYYDIRHEDDFEGAAVNLCKIAARRGVGIKVFNIRKVHSYAPHKYIVCVDCQVTS
ncbi:MAG: class I SAM-dependent methyltransferase family protein [Methanosarcinales archaeon]|nr:MAG: class I SAM-dependent methyltransferase family protein [Methanosarcinales archaeon]